jgi:tubulin beta
MTFRGQIQTREVDTCMMALQKKNSKFFVPWIPNNIMSTLCSQPPKGSKMSAALVGNNTAIQEMFVRIQNQFLAMYRRKAFMYKYLDEGKA